MRKELPTLSHSPLLKKAKERTHEGKVESGTGETMEEQSLRASPRGLPNLLCYTPQDPCPGVSLPTMRWSLPHKSLIKNLCHRLVCRPIWWRLFLRGDSQMCVQLTKPSRTLSNATQTALSWSRRRLRRCSRETRTSRKSLSVLSPGSPIKTDALVCGSHLLLVTGQP